MPAPPVLRTERIAQGRSAALREFSPAFVRFGSKADNLRMSKFVRFTAQSGQTADVSIYPLCAKSGHMQRSKNGAWPLRDKLFTRDLKTTQGRF
jgi:hypothetical protein